MNSLIRTKIIIILSFFLCSFAIDAKKCELSKSSYGYDTFCNCIETRNEMNENKTEISSRGIAVTKTGEVYVTGNFSGTIDFGNLKLSNKCGYDFFLAKFDISGKCIWAKHSQSNCYYVVGNSITVDTSGNCFVIGELQGATIIGGTPMQTRKNGNDIFIAKYDASGNCIWAEQSYTGITDYVDGSSIIADENGNIYITGRFSGRVKLGEVQLVVDQSNNDCIYIAKYDSTGNCIWARKDSSTNNFSSIWGTGITVDKNGNEYVTGMFQGIAMFGEIQLASSNVNAAEALIIKYDINGNLQWVKQSIGSTYSSGEGISIDANGNSYITGYFITKTTFGNFELKGNKKDNFILAKYDSNGNCIWAKQSGGDTSYSIIGTGIAVDDNGNSYISGYFSGSPTLGKIKLRNMGKKNIFIAKYDMNGNCIWARQNTGNDNSVAFAHGIKIDRNGNSYIIGEFNGKVKIGKNKLTSALKYGNLFIAKYDVKGNCIWAKNIK